MAINDVTFTKFSSVDLPAVDTTLYTAPALTTTALLSVVFSNKSAAPITVTVKIVRSGGATTLNVVKDAPIPVGGSLDLIENKPIVLSTGDSIRGNAGTPATIDVTGSVMEMT